MSSRSDAEREAARLERERRRAQERGEQPPAAAPTPTPADIPDAPAREAAPPEAPEPPAAAPEPPASAPEPPAPAPPAPEPDPDLEPAAPVREPAPPAPGAADLHDDHDVPIGTVRAHAGRPGRIRRHGAAAAPAAAAGPAPPGRRRRRPAGRVAILVVVGGILLALLLFAANATFTPFKGDGTGTVVVRIPAGAGARQVGNLLADKGVVDSGFFFSLRAKISGDGNKLRSGTFTLHHGMSNGAALDILTTPPKAAPVIRVTLPEGPSRSELAPLVAKDGVKGSYVRASRRSPQLRPRDYGAPKRTPSLEGFLFPATYELRPGASADTLVSKQLQAFKENLAGVSLAYAKKKKLTPYDVLIIASMVERETAVPAERRRIAGVIYNRLKQGIPLGIDATIRYADGNWSRPLRVSELQRPGPYNTRLNQGLPPTPIGNPGLASIKAAADPERSGYLFYVVRPCGNGAHAFSKTDAQFQRDVAAYNRKRAQLGGKDPSTCPK